MKNLQIRFCAVILKRWSALFGQFGALIKLFPGVVHAAILQLGVAGTSPGNRVGSIM
jgi:hypothetical protein